jgi:hypothetical protein
MVDCIFFLKYLNQCILPEILNPELAHWFELLNCPFHNCDTCITDLGNVFQYCRKYDLVRHFGSLILSKYQCFFSRTRIVKVPVSPQSYTFITILVMCLKKHIQIIAQFHVLIEVDSWFCSSLKQIFKKHVLFSFWVYG